MMFRVSSEVCGWFGWCRLGRDEVRVVGEGRVLIFGKGVVEVLVGDCLEVQIVGKDLRISLMRQDQRA